VPLLFLGTLYFASRRLSNEHACRIVPQRHNT
jgi:hypothetical protein